ncbi:MAG: ABC transporter ATP-binding protein, partial [Geobacteraceae bacterium]|nr:ABC transporter ATP-binding protein [Geobacteraceae bacterium]
MAPVRLDIAIEKFCYPDGTAALTDISLAVQQGEFCALLGANGSGKTTLLKVMDGLIRDYRGTVLLDCQNILKLHPREIYRKVGLVFQNPDDQLFAHSVAEDVAFGPRNMGFAEDEVMRRVSAALEQVDMTEDSLRNIHHLSYGQKKRVCIAGLLAMGHEILLLDEPTAGLDPNQIAEIRMLIKELGREKTVILSTHILSEVQATCSRIVIINAGKLVADGSPADLQSRMTAQQKLRAMIIGETSAIRTALKGLAPDAKVDTERGDGEAIIYILTTSETA